MRYEVIANVTKVHVQRYLIIFHFTLLFLFKQIQNEQDILLNTTFKEASFLFSEKFFMKDCQSKVQNIIKLYDLSSV